MINRVVIFLIGAAFVTIVIYLGSLARLDDSYLVLFGLAAAILTPLGIKLMGYAITAPKRKILERLSKVVEIDQLFKDAKSQEEKIALLKKERAKLSDIIKFETHRQLLLTRKNSLEDDGKRIVKELEAIDSELSQLEITVESNFPSDEISQLRKRLETRMKGGKVFRLGSSYFTIDHRILNIRILGIRIRDIIDITDWLGIRK